MKKIIISLILILLSFTSVSASTKCNINEKKLFDKSALVYSFSNGENLSYSLLNNDIKKKLDKILSKYSKKEKLILYKKIDSKLNTIFKKYFNKFNKKYTEKEEYIIKLLFGLYNYFDNEFQKIDSRFLNPKIEKETFYLENGKNLNLKSVKYPNNPKANCIKIYEGPNIIYENSDIDNKTNINYKVLENRNKMFLLFNYKKNENHFSEIYKIGGNLTSFKQPIKTLKIDRKEGYEATIKKLLKVVNMSYEEFKKMEKIKKRDSSRIMDLQTIRSGIIQYYSDMGEYPKTLNLIKDYLYYEIPKDPKEGETINSCKFGYKYEVFDDENGIENANYRLSTCFETRKYIETKAKNDDGIYDNKYEIYSR